MVNIESVEQLVNSMSDAVLQLEHAINSRDIDEANKLRVFIFDLYKEIAMTMGDKNV